MRRRYRHKINEVEAIAVLIFLMFVLNHIDTIMNILIGIAIMCGTVYISFKVIKYGYLHLRWRNSEYGYFEMVRKINNMNPREFEVFVCNLFKQLGYHAKVTEAVCDGGKDVIAWDNYGNKTYIECKHWKVGNDIGRVILQKLVGSAYADGANKAIIITTSNYNPNALEYAKKVDWLELWTKKDILKALEKIDKKKVGYVLNYLEG